MKTKVLRLLFSIIFLSGFYSCQSIDPEAPSLAEKDIPLVEQPPSKINIPIRMDLKSYFKQVETSVSNVHSDSVQECQGLRYAYMLKRSPFSINGFGNTVRLTFNGEYWIKLSYCAKCVSGHCIVPSMGTSCGIGEPLRKIKIAYSSNFNIQKNYKLQSSTSLVTLKPLSKCEATKLNLDATDKLVDYVKGPLSDLGKKLDKRIAGIDLKSRIQILWEKVSKEIQLGNLGFLSINPKELSVNSLHIDGSLLNTTIGITAYPYITTESNQQPATPLPELSSNTPGEGFAVYFDIFAGYDSLAHYLNKKIVGRTIAVEENKLIVTNSIIYGIGNQKVVIAIDFKGKRKGRIYFTGTPNYNLETNVLTFPDLAFDSKTQDLLIELKEWAYYDELKKRIRERAKFNFSNLVNRGKQKFEVGINRNLGNDVKLSGVVNSLKIHAVYPAKSQLVLRALAHGTMEIEIKK